MAFLLSYTSFFLGVSTLVLPKQQDVLNDPMRHVPQNFFFVGIGVIGLFLGIYIILSYCKKDTFNVFLGIFTLTTSLVLLELVLFWVDVLQYSPNIPFYKSLLFLWGPSLYLYLKHKTHSQIPIAISSILKHYAIFLVSLIMLLILGNVKLRPEIVEYSTTWIVLKTLTNNWVKAVYFLVYIFLMIKQYFDSRELQNQMSRTWTKSLIVFFIIIFLITVLRALFENFFHFNYLSKYFAAYFFSGFIVVHTFLNILFPANQSGEENEIEQPQGKYKNSGLTNDMLVSLKEQLVKAMEVDKLFLEHNLTLQSLSKTLNTDRYSLSQVINQEFEKNFYEFVNDYRIEESIRIIKHNPNKVRLVLDLIYESGFNNKVSFYKAFKKRKKITPAKYIKEYYEV